MEKEFNFKKEIRKISINPREEQIIKIIEEKFDEFIKLLKAEDQIDKVEGNPAYHLALKRFRKKVDKLAGENYHDS